DLELRHVRNQLLGNLVSGSDEPYLVPHDVERAAPFDAGGNALARETHADCNADELALFDPEEIEMRRLVGHRMKLDILGEHELALALVLQRNRARQEIARLQGLVDGGFVDRDRHRIALATIENAGNTVLTAGFTRAAAAGALTHVDIE